MCEIDPDKLEEAKRYDKIAFSDERMKREIPVIANYLQGKTILDIACSSGKHAFGLEDSEFISFGFDISPEMIHMAQENAKQRNSKVKFLIRETVSSNFGSSK